MIRFDSAALGLAGLLLAVTGAQAQEPATCDPATDRCSGLVRLVAEGDQTFATVSLQVGKSRADAVLFVIAPLGIAARPGVRIVANPGAVEIPLPLDVCFPDGCRASADLSAEQLAQVTGAQTLSVQFIPFSSTETVSGELAVADLIAPLRQAGVNLP
ncbi:invasion associated locus B family protein [Paracoccus shandongensis]|uniref:invasion associated locus B family protein n=1 Tax=Paracoccus shandongensis TaxID=2816048 RepID=UPI001A8F3D58|nr:invasion associated locus B family protein [Paracoccus shandongensis]